MQAADNLIERWLYLSGFSEQTKRTYGYHARRFTEWMQENDLQLGEISAVDFLKYLDSHSWGSSVRYQAWSAVKSFLRSIDQESHPIFRLNLKREPAPPQRAFKHEVVERIIAATDVEKPNGIRNRAIILLLYDTGLRSSELCGLLLENVNLEERELKAFVKGRRWRLAKFSPRTAEWMRRWLDVRDEHADRGCGTFFCSIGGTKPGAGLSSRGLRQIMRAIGERVGVKLSPHDLRRSFATNALRGGAPAPVVMLQGGWTSPTVFQKYIETLTPSDFEAYFPTMNGHEEENDAEK